MVGRRQPVCSSVLSTISSQVTEPQGPVGGLCKVLGTMEVMVRELRQGFPLQDGG